MTEWICNHFFVFYMIGVGLSLMLFWVVNKVIGYPHNAKVEEALVYSSASWVWLIIGVVIIVAWLVEKIIGFAIDNIEIKGKTLREWYE